MEQFIKDSGKVLKDMVTGFRSGQMVLAMKENGEEIKLMAEENFGMLMEISSMESGKMTKLMDMEFIHM